MYARRSIKVKCPVCGQERYAKVKEDRVREYLSAKSHMMCTKCKLEAYSERVVAKCKICGKDYITHKVGEHLFHTTCGDKKCRVAAQSSTHKEFNRGAFTITVSQDFLNKLEQELLVNGESAVLEMINIGKREMFGRSFYVDETTSISQLRKSYD